MDRRFACSFPARHPRETCRVVLQSLQPLPAVRGVKVHPEAANVIGGVWGLRFVH
jgi:hypothetical protein